MTDLGALILQLFTHLRTTLGQVQRQDRAYNNRLLLVWNCWGRTMQRLKTLWERWKSNTLPKPRPSRAGQPRKPRPPKPEGTLPYPSGCAWLVHNNWQVNGAGEGLRMHLETPAFQEFLKAVPQAGRLIRPVLKLLHIAPPAVIALPKRPRKPRPRKPAPEPLVINPHAHVPYGLGAAITRRLRKSGFTIAPRIPKISTSW